jgi:hypothetical protein
VSESNTDDGGPAFPLDINDDVSGRVNVGMSLRDYFAAAALTGLLAADGQHGRWAEIVEHGFQPGGG